MSEVYIHLTQIPLKSVFHNSWHLILVKIPCLRWLPARQGENNSDGLHSNKAAFLICQINLGLIETWPNLDQILPHLLYILGQIWFVIWSTSEPNQIGIDFFIYLQDIWVSDAIYFVNSSLLQQSTPTTRCSHPRASRLGWSSSESLPLFPPNITMVIMAKQFYFCFIRPEDISPKSTMFDPMCSCKP